MKSRVHAAIALSLGLLVATGCSTIGESLGFSTPTNPLSKNAKAIRDTAPVPAPVPRELAMSLLPAHVVEAGDTLLVQPVELDAPIRLPPDQPVQPDGTIDLGQYGRPVVAGRTLPEVEVVVRDAIRAKAKGKEAEGVAITVRLLAKPGKVFYVLGEVNAPGAFPITGHDTVLSAITQAGGPTRRASPQNIIVSRPTAPEGCRIVLPVCYTNIVQLGDTSTNYQLMPGDRVFIPSKGTFEDILGGRGRKAGPCNGPQVSCFGGACGPTATGCAPAAGGTVPVPALPHTHQ